MASARGDALDWALALARVPAERHALRQRPLPDGMDTVLQIAGGTHAAAIEDAAAYAGMAPADVVEAARFYLREMLFYPDADVYRVLGLAADATDEQIKHHHRLLQQWLHPDRPASDWDAAFAARVNAAWSQLRTPARREAHAARMGATTSAAASEPNWSQPARMPAMAMAAEEFDASIDDNRWRRRAPVLALFAVCAALGVLAVRDMRREPESTLVGADLGEEALAEQLPATVLQVPAAVEKPSASETPIAQERRPAPPRVAAAPPVRVSPPLVAPVKPTAKAVSPAAQRPAAVAMASKPVPKPIEKPMAPAARSASSPPTAIAAAPKPNVVPRKPTPTVVAQVATPKPPIAVSTPAIKPTARIAAASVPVPVKPPAKTLSAAAAVPVKPVVKTSPAAPALPSKPRPETSTASAPTPNRVKPTVQTPAVVASKTPATPVVAVAKPIAKPPVQAESVAARPPDPKPIVAPAPAAPVAASPAPAVPANSPAQVAQAQQTGQRLLDFVAGRGSGMPPIWANLGAQNQAALAREALQGNGRIAVGAPNWRLGGANAGMQASLSPAEGKARRLRVDMVWRERRWLVTGLTLEQAP